MLLKRFLPFTIFTLFFINNIYAYRCTETSCSDIRGGVGIFHNNVNFNPLPQLNSTGGYLSAFISKYWKWFYLSAGVTAGIGSSHIKDSNEYKTMIKDTSGILNLEYYLGSNLGSLENPILLSFALYLDGYDLVQNNPNHKLNNKMSFVGIDIAGHITINKNIDIEYKAGYSYLFSGVYWIRSYANKSYLNGGHRFEVSIGMLYRQNRDNLIQTEVNKKLDFYTRFKVIYYDINASDVILINSKPINYPMSKNLMFMLEFGIASHFNYRIFH